MEVEPAGGFMFPFLIAKKKQNKNWTWWTGAKPLFSLLLLGEFAMEDVIEASLSTASV